MGLNRLFYILNLTIILTFVAFEEARSARAEDRPFGGLFRPFIFPPNVCRSDYVFDDDLKKQQEMHRKFQEDDDSFSNLLALFTIVSDHLAFRREGNKSNHSECVIIESFAKYNCSSGLNRVKISPNIPDPFAPNISDPEAPTLINWFKMTFGQFGTSQTFSGNRSHLSQRSHLFCLTPSECKNSDDFHDKIKDEYPFKSDFTPDTHSYGEASNLYWFIQNLIRWVPDSLMPALFELISPENLFLVWSESLIKAGTTYVINPFFADLSGKKPREFISCFCGAISDESLKSTAFYVTYSFASLIQWGAEKVLPTQDCSRDLRKPESVTDGQNEGGCEWRSNITRSYYEAFYCSITTDKFWIAAYGKLLFKICIKISRGGDRIRDLQSAMRDDSDGSKGQLKKARGGLIEFISGFFIKYFITGRWI